MAAKATRWLALLLVAILVKGLVFPDKLVEQQTLTLGRQVFIGMVGLILLWSGAAQWGAWKHMSPSFMAGGLTTSMTSDDMFHTGEWAALRLGGLNVPRIGLTAKGREGTVVMPILAYEWFERGIFVKGVAKKASVDELPKDLATFIETEGLPTPIWLIEAPATVEEHNKAFRVWSRRTREEEEWRAIQEKMNERTRDLVEDVIGTRGRLERKTSGTLGKIYEKATRDEEEERR